MQSPNNPLLECYIQRVYIYVYRYIYIYAYIHMYMYIYVCMYTYVYIYTYVHTYIYTYTLHMYINIYIYVHTYISIFVMRSFVNAQRHISVHQLLRASDDSSIIFAKRRTPHSLFPPGPLSYVALPALYTRLIADCM